MCSGGAKSATLEEKHLQQQKLASVGGKCATVRGRSELLGHFRRLPPASEIRLGRNPQKPGCL